MFLPTGISKSALTVQRVFSRWAEMIWLTAHCFWPLFFLGLFIEWAWERYIGGPAREYRWHMARMSTVRWASESFREGSLYEDRGIHEGTGGLFSASPDRPKTRLLRATVWRLENYLVTTTHALNVVSGEELYVSVDRERFFLVPREAWIDLAEDISVIPVPIGLGIRKMKVGPIQQNVYVGCSSFHERQNYTLGLLRKQEGNFGLLAYEGSTRGGFSGAPYLSVGRVVGMHAGGGVMNYGYPAEYIYMLLRRYERTLRKPEDSTVAAIQAMLSRAVRKSEITVQMVAPDEYQIEVRGKYYILDDEEYAELIQDERYEDYFYEEYEDQGERKRRRKVKRDVEVLEERIPEAADGIESAVEVKEEEVPFLEECSVPQMVEVGTDCLTQPIMQTRSTDTSGLQPTAIPLPPPPPSIDLSTFTSTLEGKLLANLSRLVETNMQQLGRGLLEETISVFDDRLDRMMQILETTSNECCERLTQKVQQVLDASKTTLQSNKHWAGMDSALHKFELWRNSVNVSDPEYASWRKAFLEKELGLSEEQSSVLIRRYANRKKSGKQPLARSNSLSKMNPTSSRN